MGLPLAKPNRIGKYEITGIIGRGGMGTVYRATDPRIGRPVAIKVLTATFGNDAELLARFYREAKYTGTLQHQNIVTVYELGDQEGFPYLVMEYLEGESLDAIIKSHSPLVMARKLGIIIQVCNGLSFAHNHGVVHRDIKPANIVVLPNGTTKIVDFGIAHVAEIGEKGITRTGQVVGSVFYMSPEQLNDSMEVDSRTDVYSTGVVLYQLLTGVLPFEGRDTGSTLLKIVNDPAPPLGQFLRVCPPDLEAICQKALAKKRDQRYLTAEDFAFDLVRVQQQLHRTMVAEHLQQATDAIELQDLDGAKGQLSEVLRLDPQNDRANQLVQEIHQKLELKRKQAFEFQSQAQDAFSGKNFHVAIQYAEQGLQLDAGNRDLARLRDDARRAQARVRNFKELLQRAVLAAQQGNLEEARRGVEQALELQPDDPQAKDLAARIGQINQQTHQENSRVEAKQFAFAVNAVEKAMADARMLRYLGQNREAWEALEKVSREISQVNPELRSLWEDLRAQLKSLSAKQANEALDKDAFPVSLNSQEPSQFSEDRSSEFHATSISLTESPSTAPQSSLFPHQSPADVLGGSSGPPQTLATEAAAEREVPEELEEFLPVPNSGWRKPVLLVSILIMIAAGVAAYVKFWPKVDHPATTAAVTPQPAPANAPEAAVMSSYVEINAEPWGKVQDIASATGESISKPDDYTPLRLNIHPGKYSVTVEGPGREKKQLVVEVPEQGGSSYFVVFRKPDIARMLAGK